MKRLITLCLGAAALCGCGSEHTTPTAPPSAPSELVATAVSSTEINLTWADNSNSETGFIIERAVGYGMPVQYTSVFSRLTSVSKNVTTYSDTSTEPSTTYYYRICATSSAGISGYSSGITVMTLYPPKFIDKGNGTIYDSVNNLSWLKDANCFYGKLRWSDASSSVHISNGQCGLSDGSSPQDWHIPSAAEFSSFVRGYNYTMLQTAGFQNVQDGQYWTSDWPSVTEGEIVEMHNGTILNIIASEPSFFLWPVRVGQ